MNRSPQTTQDTLLILIVAVLALLGVAGASVWAAAQLVLLIHEQRLLTNGSGDVLDVAVGLLAHPRDPSLVFAPADRAVLPRSGGLYAVAVPMLAAAVIAACVAWQSVRGWVGGIGDGSDGATWASAAQVRHLHVRRTEDGRLVLGTAHGKLIATQPYRSVFVVGPTGSGKTSAFVVPVLLEHPGPAIALSTRSGFLRPTHRARAARGPVLVFDPLRVTGHPCAAWTPLRSCHTLSEARRVAELLTGAVTDNDKYSRFWNVMGSKMLEALFHAAALDDRPMRDVIRWVDTREQAEVAKILKRHKADEALQSWTASQSRHERTLSDIYASTEMLLRAFSEPAIASVKPSQSFDPSDLLTANGTLYLCAPTEDQERLRSVFITITKDVYRTAILMAERSQGPLSPGLLLALDEAATIAPLPNLAEIAATCREYGIQLVTACQDLAQLVHIYGKHATTILNNHTAIVVMGGSTDTELLDTITRLLGERTVAHTTTSVSSTGTNVSSSTHHRPLAAIHQLRELPDDHALLLYGRLRPINLRLRPYYSTPSLTRLANTPTTPPSHDSSQEAA